MSAMRSSAPDVTRDRVRPGVPSQKLPDAPPPLKPPPPPNDMPAEPDEPDVLLDEIEWLVPL